MKKKPRKAYWDMTSEELTEATKSLIGKGPFFAPSRSARKCVENGRRPKNGGVPKYGGSKRVLISMETGLLFRADKLARRRGIGRSELIAEGLKTLLAKAS